MKDRSQGAKRLDRPHVFKSFKQRIDSIKIEPNRNLLVRAHDYVETSHFLASLQYWKEVNLSGTFSDFLLEVEPLAQTLPQILHHHDKIFGLLQVSISKLDVNSLQPLLDLLSQFIHDMGSDFMQHYPTFIHLIMKVAQSLDSDSHSHSQCLEHCFTCLAFCFKYLSRSLTENLEETFQQLLPLFETDRRLFVSRFCAEAFSFLIKKLSTKNLDVFLDSLFINRRETLRENQTFREVITILFSESMKNTQDSFHTKASTIYNSLLKQCLIADSQSDLAVSCLCDVLMSAMSQTSEAACIKFSLKVLESLLEIPSTPRSGNLLMISNILIAICFVDSGRKVSEWSTVFELVACFIKAFENMSLTASVGHERLMSSFTFLCVILVRNSEMGLISKYFRPMCECMVKCGGYDLFFAFLESSAVMAGARLESLGSARVLQSVVNDMTSPVDLMLLSSFLRAAQNQNLFILKHFVIPHGIADQLLSLIECDIQEAGLSLLSQIHWKLFILQFCSSFSNHDAPLHQILDYNFTPPNNSLESEVFGLTLKVCAEILLEGSLGRILDRILAKFEDHKSSESFLDGVASIFNISDAAVSAFVTLNVAFFRDCCVKNLSSSNGDLRSKTAEFMARLYILSNREIPIILHHIQLIQHIPLHVSNANDVKLRIRHLASAFVSLDNKTEQDFIQVTNFAIGQLKNNYQPSWDAIYDVIGQLCDAGCSEQMFRSCMNAIRSKIPALSHTVQPSPVFVENEKNYDLLSCVSNEKLRSIITLHSSRWAQLVAPSSFEDKISNPKHTTGHTGSLFVLRVIKALDCIPAVVERNAKEFLDLVLSCHEEQNSTEVTTSALSEKETMALSNICSKFRNIGKVEGNELVFRQFCRMLSSRHTNSQRAYLNILFAWRIPDIKKYKDNLENLLDDKLFRDEIHSLFDSNSESRIPDDASTEFMSVLLRIVYGRAKGGSNDSTGKNRKFAALSALTNVPQKFMVSFLDMISEDLGWESYFASNVVPSLAKENSKRFAGFLNLLHNLCETLGHKFSKAFTHALKPLIYTLVVVQNAVEANSSEEHPGKVARALRQSGFKCLGLLFELTGDSHNWASDSIIIMKHIVHPRLSSFTNENLQQPSALMHMMLHWIDVPQLVQLYSHDNYLPLLAIMGVLKNVHCKDSVRVAIMDFCLSAMTKPWAKIESFHHGMALIVDELLNILPTIIEQADNREVISRAATLVLLIIEGEFIADQVTMGKLIASCTAAIGKPPAHINSGDRISLILSLIALMKNFNALFDSLRHLYVKCSQSLRFAKDITMRQALIQFFDEIGTKFPEMRISAQILSDINTANTSQAGKADYSKIIPAFQALCGPTGHSFNITQWLPIVNSCLFFMDDEIESVLRTNASSTLISLVNSIAANSTAEMQSIADFCRDFVLKEVKMGLRKESVLVRDEYVKLLAQFVKSHQMFPALESMKVLMSADLDSDFFQNFTHIQIGRRQQAVRSLLDARDSLSSESIVDFILPMTKIYVVCKDESQRNLLNDTHEAWSGLSQKLDWVHMRSLIKQSIASLQKAPEGELKDRVHLIVQLTRGLRHSHGANFNTSSPNVGDGTPNLRSKIESTILAEFFNPITKILSVRNDDTITSRSPLVEAAVNCLLCLPRTQVEVYVRAALTSTCQALRSKTQHVRDAVRKSLCRVAEILGSPYLKFIFQELRSALSRGSQIHVLSYSVHSVLSAVEAQLKTGDLDDCALLVVDIAMEDIFGSAGQDKDSEGYVSKMKEVKSKKSFDTSEMLAKYINLRMFRKLVEPIKMLLEMSVSLKTKRMLDELLRKFAAGVSNNLQSNEIDILVLCYELHKYSTEESASKGKLNSKILLEEDQHFIVEVNARQNKILSDSSQNIVAFQKLSFEMTRSALKKHPHFLTAEKLAGFLPLIKSSIDLNDESLQIALFQLLITVSKVSLPDEVSYHEQFAEKAFETIQNSASTSNELCQMCLRYLALLVKSKPQVELRTSAIVYLLTRILPDLEELDTQSLAFGFLKSLLFRHTKLPEIYDVMDKILPLIVVSPIREVRDSSRAIYLQFLMEYEQSQQRLDKVFKFIVTNLRYPAENGKLSVMELMHTMMRKFPDALFRQLNVSFFVGLAHVMISDETTSCREMSTVLISQLLKRSKNTELDELMNLCSTWMKQDNNVLLQRCGLNVYKIYLSNNEIGDHPKLDATAIRRMTSILSSSVKNSSEQEVAWEQVYTAVNVFAAIYEKQKEISASETYASTWDNLIDSMLYPHTWVRLSCSRLVCLLLSNLGKQNTVPSLRQLQTIAFRLHRQLCAPVVSKELGVHIAQSMIKIVTYWESHDVKYMDDDQTSGNGDKTELKIEAPPAIDILINRICSSLRQEGKSELCEQARATTIQLLALLPEVISNRHMLQLSRSIVMSLQLTARRSYTQDLQEISALSKEALSHIEQKIGVAEFSAISVSVRNDIELRRRDRREARAQLQVTAPEAAARRNTKKHERAKEKRKHNKDDRGLYKPKAKRKKPMT